MEMFQDMMDAFTDFFKEIMDFDYNFDEDEIPKTPYFFKSHVRIYDKRPHKQHRIRNNCRKERYTMTENEIIGILKSYAKYDRFINAQNYAKEFFDPGERLTAIDETECRKNMQIIENLIKLLCPSDEYTLLFLHYIKNIPVEKCGECMNISRSTAFRLLKKAHKDLTGKYNYFVCKGEKHNE